MFDIEKFKNTSFVCRKKDLKYPAIDGTDGPTFVVRNLTGPEIAQCNDAISQNRNLKAVIEKIVSPISAEKAQGIADMLGLNKENLTDEYVRRLYLCKLMKT